MRTFTVEFINGVVQTFEVIEDYISEGVLLITGEEYNTVIPIHAFKKITVKNKTDEPAT